MQVYHDIQPDALEAALTNGLFCTVRGDKGQDQAIIAADRFLDERCPHTLKAQGVSRANNVYAYLVVDGAVIDITDGSATTLDSFLHNRPNRILQLTVDPNRCFVSDLDTYDAVKAALVSNSDSSYLDTLAASYWRKLTPLPHFVPGSIRRPEPMITYNIPPTHLSAVS